MFPPIQKQNGILVQNLLFLSAGIFCRKICSKFRFQTKLNKRECSSVHRCHFVSHMFYVPSYCTCKFVIEILKSDMDQVTFVLCKEWFLFLKLNFSVHKVQFCIDLFFNSLINHCLMMQVILALININQKFEKAGFYLISK